MNIVDAIELLEHKLFDQGRSEQYTAYDKLIDDAWDLLKSKLDLTDDEFNQIFAQSSYYRPEVTKILRKKNITQDPDLPDPDVGC
ncbi:MAG: hypothetical protein CMG35_10245 [Candidatus Marinimicrobia bacterium]|jgi:hypothetical protein|nr:hypothetical protein [Candidatus Neomarinimicrobiota bacterium]MBO03010.1 hypothetical protein [Candidatus Neomarinimicrobiota bacterium]|tara:strand:- start:1778 stop:2032 length:255 start_codon:yes stop_codon:yes gene_type:complete